MLFESITYNDILSYLAEQIYNSANNINSKFDSIDSKFKYNWTETGTGESKINNYKWPGDDAKYNINWYLPWGGWWQYTVVEGKVYDYSGPQPSYTIRQTNAYYIQQCSTNVQGILGSMTGCYKLYISNQQFDFRSKILNANQFLFFLEFILLYFESSLRLYTSMLSDQCNLVYTLIQSVDTSGIHRIPNSRKLDTDLVNLAETIGDSTMSIDGVLNAIWILLQNKVAYVACEYNITDSRSTDKSATVNVKQLIKSGTKEVTPEEDVARITGAGSYVKNSNVTINLEEVSPGYKFINYKNQDGTSHENPYSFTITKNTNITAYFNESVDYTLTYQSSETSQGYSVTNKISKEYQLLSLATLKSKKVEGFKDRKSGDSILQWSTSPNYSYNYQRYPNEVKTYFNQNLTIYPFYKNDNNLAVQYTTEHKTIKTITDCIVQTNTTQFEIRGITWLTNYSGIKFSDLYPSASDKFLDYWQYTDGSGTIAKTYNINPGISAYSQLTSYIPGIKSLKTITLTPVFKS